MTHTSTEQPSLAAIIHDLRESHARTSPGTWGKGATTHETVSRAEGREPYKVADFRHANDAQFCDLAHVFVPRLLSEIEALQSRVQELGEMARENRSKRIVELEGCIEELEALLFAIAHTAEGATAQTGAYAEARECEHCNHVGINDAANGIASCTACKWNGDSPKEDKCPDCEAEGTMTASCPKCHHEYRLIADATLAATPAACELATLQAGLQAAAPAVLPEPVPSGMRLVNAGALQMVINALRRDAEEGKAVRGEMADELLATVGLPQAGQGA